MTYEEAREATITRDEKKCVICGEEGKQTHHIRHITAFHPEETPNNLVLLCRYCHYMAHRGCFHHSEKSKVSPQYAVDVLQRRSINNSNFELIKKIVEEDVIATREHERMKAVADAAGVSIAQFVCDAVNEKAGCKIISSKKEDG